MRTGCKNTNVVVAKNATTSQKWIATPYYSEINSVSLKKSTISSSIAVTRTL